MSKLTKRQLETLTNEIINFLKKHELFYDISIYCNNKKYHDGNNGEIEIIDDINPADIVEYNNPDTITMTFEGGFYHIINYDYDMSYCDFIIEEFDKILDKYGLYYELGHAWSLALYYN